MIAIDALTELKKNSLKVPEDVSLVGFDDITLASLVLPPLTTLAQPIYEMGARAMNLLLENMKKKSLKSKIILETKLVIRESTGRAKVR